MIPAKAIAGRLGLAVSLLAIRASAKDLQITMWNSSECSRRSPNDMPKIIQIPRDHDGDPHASIRCTKLVNQNFGGWLRDTHSDQVIAFVDTYPIAEDCQLVFYNQGPTADQFPEQINSSPCWQAYRRLSKHSTCSSVNFDPRNFAVS